MISSGKSVEIKCRRCGKMAKAEDFVLDYVYKMAVCPSCVRERKVNEAKAVKQPVKEAESQAVETPKVQRPAGWDEEDEYLEKLSRQKEKASMSSTPKPHQMGGLGSASQSSMQRQPYSEPRQSYIEEQHKPRQIAQPSSQPTEAGRSSLMGFAMKATGREQTAAPKTEPRVEPKQVAQPSSKPTESGKMGLMGFAMRATGRSEETPKAEARQEVKQSAPMRQEAPQRTTTSTDFGLRSSNKASEPKPSTFVQERVERVSSDPNKMKYKCKKCGYEFWYNRERNTPKVCPYCNTQVMHLV